MLRTMFAITIALFFSCQPTSPTEINPAAPGFDLRGSDPKAVSIADEVMEAMGGRLAWDNSRYITWNFFGSRKHIWDKKTGNVRIESFRDSTTYLMNIETLEGQVKHKEKQLSGSDSLQTYLERGRSIWINDSYWLIMPFKLKDTGVTLKYIGEDETEDGKKADVLSLTFKEVGDTPQNKYHVFVDKQTRLVSQWSFFRNAEQDTANFTTPWADYEKCGGILLSSNRGKNSLSEISVDENLPEKTFTQF